MFKTPFNYRVGENRTCRYCGADFHTIKPVWRCGTCVNEQQRKIQEKKRLSYGKKDQYPFDNISTEASNRFTSIRKKLRDAWEGGREALTQHYTNQLNEIEENGIMSWINDRRTNEAKREAKGKSANRIKGDYPDTRNYYED